MAKDKGLGKLIRESGYTQQAVANALYYNLRTISYWISGFTEPCARDMLKLADILNVPVERIVRIFGEA